jgi:hypothetical protein
VLCAAADVPPGVSILAISTYDTDYVLVREQDFAAEVERLRAAGHDVTRT